MYKELRDHILELFKSNMRLDGRKFTEYRKPLKVDVNVTKTAEGFSLVLLAVGFIGLIVSRRRV